MKKFVSKIYFVCIVIGILVCMIGICYQDKNLHIGKVWEGTPEEIFPESEIQETNDIKVYCFDADNFREGRDSIFFYSAHINIKAYVDEITEENLIYAFVGRPSLFGSTPGSNYHIIELPNYCKRVYVVAQTVYPNITTRQLIFYRSNGVAAYRILLWSSVAEAFICGALIILGIIMIFYCFYAKNRIQVDDSIIYFAFFTSLLGAWTFNETNMSVLLFSNRTLCSFVAFIMLLSMQQPLLLFTRAFLKVKEEIVCNIFCVAITILTIILVSLHISGIAEMRSTVWAIQFSLFADLGYMLYCYIYHIHHFGFTRRVVVNVIGAGILLFAGLVDMSAYYATSRINDVIGRCGMLAYTIILATEVMSEFTHQMQENRKTMYYKELAMLDTLTGLQNRNAYENWERTNNSNEKVSLITFDLNNLKECNDTKGHIVGDQYIVDAAKMIYDTFGRNGDCYRIGGDEFLVVLKNINSEAQIEKYIQKLRKTEHEYNIHSSDIKMKIACGYARFSKDDKELEDVRNRADFCMYMNKSEIKKQSGE